MKKVEVLFTMMKDGSKVPVEKMIKTLNVKQGSIMCLISALRNDFGAEIETERDGRKVLTYQLMNADKVTIPTKTSKSVSTKTPKTKTPKTPKTPKKQKVSVTKTAVSTKSKSAPVTEDVGSYEVEEISDAELADLRGQLGI